MENLPELSVRHLKAIAALARFQSFVAAAAYLKVSQSGLTRLIQQAERLVGAQLFIRTPRDVKKTEAGQLLSHAAERLLSDLAIQVESVRALDNEWRGQITISSLMSISHRVLPQALMEFRRLYPSIRIHVREKLASAVNEDVRRAAADFGIADIDGATEDLNTETIVEESCFLVLPRDHRLAGIKRIGLADISDEPMISMPPEAGLRNTIDLAANTQGVSLNHSIIINQFGSLFDFVSNGLGVAIVPAVALPEGGREEFAIRKIAPRITRRIGILHPKGRMPAAVTVAFLEIFRPLFKAAVK